MKPLDPESPGNILIRATNWVGDAIMTLPALDALAQAAPQARIEVLAKPWVAPIYLNHPKVSRVVIFEHSRKHSGPGGLLRLCSKLRGRNYDWAVLFQNAFQAGLIACLCRAGVRLGYGSDGRRLLLTHPVERSPQVRQIHETSYYLNILFQAGILNQEPPAEGVCPHLHLAEADLTWARRFITKKRLDRGLILGMAPGAAFGPAKCWPAERFSALADALNSDGFKSLVLFGSKGEDQTCQEVAGGVNKLKVFNLAGRTSLGRAMALLSVLNAFVTNDSGLMHASAALGTPTVAVFGSTNPVTTGPLGGRVRMVRKPVDCSPCLKPVCPTDLRCFTGIEPEEVAQTTRELLEASQ